MTLRASVIIQTYNHERFIGQAIDGVLGQRTGFDVEIIITEDCSTDATRQIVRSYAEHHGDRIRLLLSETNLNDNSVFTRALDAAGGEFVANLDGDDFWTDRGKLQRQVDYLDRHPECALCFHNVLNVYDDGAHSPHPNLRWDIPARSGTVELLGGNFIPNCSALVRRAAIDPRPAWYDGEILQDWALWLLASMNGEVHYIDDILAAYRIHSSNWWITRSEREILEEDIRFLDSAERGLRIPDAAALHRSRARYRRQLVAELLRERAGLEALGQVAAGLWRDRRGRSARETLADAAGPVARLLGSPTDPAGRRMTELARIRQSRDEIRSAITRIDEAVIALLNERDHLAPLLTEAPDRAMKFVPAGSIAPFTDPVAVLARRRAEAYDRFLPGVWIGFDRACEAHVEIGQEPKVNGSLSPFDHRFLFEIEVIDSAGSGWVSLEMAADGSPAAAAQRVTVVLRARARAPAPVQFELSVPLTGGDSHRVPIGRVNLSERFESAVVTSLVGLAGVDNVDPTRPPSIIMFLPPESGSAVTLAYYRVFFSPAQHGGRGARPSS